jgi:hypothetical protein
MREPQDRQSRHHSDFMTLFASATGLGMLLACECANLIRRIDTRATEAAHAGGYPTALDASRRRRHLMEAAPAAKPRRQSPRWTYDISASTEVGRQKHDILALGYILNLLRRFTGPRWTPPRAEVIWPPVMGRAAVQDELCAGKHPRDGTASDFHGVGERTV